MCPKTGIIKNKSILCRFRGLRNPGFSWDTLFPCLFFLVYFRRKCMHIIDKKFINSIICDDMESLGIEGFLQRERGGILWRQTILIRK